MSLIDAGIVKNIFNSILNGINYSFLNVIPTALKAFITILLTSLIVLSIFGGICFVIAIIYFLVKNTIQKQPDESLLYVIKKTFIYLFDRIKHPVDNDIVTDIIHKNMPLIAILGCFIGLWKEMLPLIILSIFLNKRISEKIHFKVDKLLLIFLLVLIYVHWALI